VAAEATRSGDHTLQFYATDTYLVQGVAPYLAAGLGRGEPVAVLCTAEHLRLIGDALATRGHDVAHLRRLGLFQWHDAEECSRRVLVGDQVDPTFFNREMAEPVIRLAQRFPGRPVRLYGEVVDLLFGSDHFDAAIQLEGLWSAVAREQNISLLCSYRVAAALRPSVMLRRIASAHEQVLPPETYAASATLEDMRAHLFAHDQRDLLDLLRARDLRVVEGLREDVGQTLAALLLLTRQLRDELPPTQAAKADALLQYVDDALQKTLGLAKDMTPVDLGAVPVAQAVRAFADLAARIYDVRCTVTVAEGFVDPPRPRKDHLYLVAQGLIERGARPAGATHINVSLVGQAGSGEMRVEHDGVGAVSHGPHDDGLGRLVDHFRLLGGRCERVPLPGGRIETVCSW